MNKNNLCIVLPTYNRLYSIRSILLPGINTLNPSKYKLVVVDDNSNDGTAEYFQDKKYSKEFTNIKNVLYIRNESNLGAPESRNIAVGLATTEWILILEDDIEISDANFLEKWSIIANKLDQNVAVVCPKREESIDIGYYVNRGDCFAKIGRISREIYIDPTKEYTGFIKSAHASCFVKREIYNRFKQDSKLLYGNTFRDESDLYAQIINSNYKILYCGNVLKFKHRNDIAISGGQKKINNLNLIKQEFMLWRNHYRFIKKNYKYSKIGIITFILVRSIKISSRLLHISSMRKILPAIGL